MLLCRDGRVCLETRFRSANSTRMIRAILVRCVLQHAGLALICGVTARTATCLLVFFVYEPMLLLVPQSNGGKSCVETLFSFSLCCHSLSLTPRLRYSTLAYNPCGGDVGMVTREGGATVCRVFACDRSAVSITLAVMRAVNAS